MHRTSVNLVMYSQLIQLFKVCEVNYLLPLSGYRSVFQMQNILNPYKNSYSKIFFFCITLLSLNHSHFLPFIIFFLPPSVPTSFYSIHPYVPLLATSSGQRQFPWPGDSEGDSASDGEGGEAVMSPQEIRQDNALTLWWAGPISPATEGNQEPSTVVVET